MFARISKNAISLAVAGLIDKLSGVLLFAIIARKLTQEEMGTYSLAFNLLFLGGLLANFGLEYVIIREVAKYRDRASALLCNSLLITLVFSVAAWPLIVGVALILNYPSEVVSLVGISGLTLVFMGLGQTAGGVLKAYERMEILALIGSVKSVLGLVLGVLVLRMGGGALALILVLMATEVSRTAVLTLIIHRRFTPVIWIFDKEVARRIVRLALPFALLAICGILIRRADIFLMGWLRPLNDVAVYTVAGKATDFLDLLTASMVGALFPAFSARTIGARRESWRLYTDSIAMFAVLGFGAAFLIVVLARPILLLLSGEPYLVGATALRWLGVAFLFTVLGGPVGTVFMAAKDQIYRLVVLSAFVIVCNVALNLWLIPVYGYNGAGISMCASTGIALAGRLILARSYYGQWPNLPSALWRPLVAGLGMALVLILLRSLNAFVLLIVAGLTYALLLVALGEMRQDRYEPIRRRVAILGSKVIGSLLH